MPPVRNDLAAGWFSSLVQRPGADRQEGLHGMVAQRSQAATRLQEHTLAPGDRVIQHRLPGDVPRIVAKAPEGIAATIRCVETGKELPRVPREWAPAVKDYYRRCRIAANPGATAFKVDPEATGIKDAFREKVDGHPLLPPEITQSSLLNRGGAGRVPDDRPNTLFDPATGLAASISLRNGNEVVIAFGGCGSQDGTLAQVVRCAINLMGLAPPASFPQAARLTALVKARVDALNAALPSDKQLKLTLAGHSMGGGIATYAALRCGVPAMVMAPMRLGYMARQSLGSSVVAQAPHLVTEVSCERDWVAANPLSRLMHWMGWKNSVGAIGSRYLIGLPSAADLAKLSTQVAANFSPHADLDVALEIQVAKEKKAQRDAEKKEGLRQWAEASAHYEDDKSS